MSGYLTLTSKTPVDADPREFERAVVCSAIIAKLQSQMALQREMIATLAMWVELGSQGIAASDVVSLSPLPYDKMTRDQIAWFKSIGLKPHDLKHVEGDYYCAVKLRGDRVHPLARPVKIPKG